MTNVTRLPGRPGVTHATDSGKGGAGKGGGHGSEGRGTRRYDGRREGRRMRRYDGRRGRAGGYLSGRTTPRIGIEPAPPIVTFLPGRGAFTIAPSPMYIPTWVASEK